MKFALLIAALAIATPALAEEVGVGVGVGPVPIWRGWNGRRRTVRATCGPTKPQSATFGLILGTLGSALDCSLP